jgi:hypothetical protein
MIGEKLICNTSHNSIDDQSLQTSPRSFLITWMIQGLLPKGTVNSIAFKDYVHLYKQLGKCSVRKIQDNLMANCMRLRL